MSKTDLFWVGFIAGGTFSGVLTMLIRACS